MKTNWLLAIYTGNQSWPNGWEPVALGDVDALNNLADRLVAEGTREGQIRISPISTRKENVPC